MSIASGLLLSLLAAPPPAKIVVFAAPEPLRAPMAAAIAASGATGVDASAVYEALFGEGGAESRVFPGARSFTLDASLPKEVRGDFASGLPACLAPKKRKPGPPFCNGQLVGAVWQRHLERVGAVEVRVIKKLLKSTEGQPETMSVHSVIVDVYATKAARKHESNLSALGPSASLESVAQSVVALSLTDTNMPRDPSSTLPK